MPKFDIAHKAISEQNEFQCLLLLSGFVCFMFIISCAVVHSDRVVTFFSLCFTFYFLLLTDPCYLLQQSWKIWGTLCWGALEWALTISKLSKIQTRGRTAFSSRSNTTWRKAWMDESGWAGITVFKALLHHIPRPYIQIESRILFWRRGMNTRDWIIALCLHLLHVRDLFPRCELVWCAFWNSIFRRYEVSCFFPVVTVPSPYRGLHFHCIRFKLPSRLRFT